MIQAVLTNGQHPEYGVVMKTVPWSLQCLWGCQAKRIAFSIYQCRTASSIA